MTVRPYLPRHRWCPLAFVALLAAQPASAAAAAASPQQVIEFQQGAQPLDRALVQLAGRTGLLIGVDAALVRDRQAPALNGRYTAQTALRALLEGSGLEAVQAADGSWALRRAAVQPAPTPAPAASAAARAGAAGSPPETVLPVVTVKAGAEQETAAGPVPGYVARRAATATKTDRPIVETPQSISVVGAQEMEDKGAATLTEALQQTPGVAVNPYGFDSRAPDWITLRGFDGWYTSSYRDGLIQNVGITFLGVQTEVYGLERVEVVRGPASVLFGKGDVGGVVNRVSKLPSADAVREIALQVGSFNRRQIAIDLGGPLDEDKRLTYRLVGVGLDTGSQERYPSGQRMTQERRYLAPSLRWELTPATVVTLQAEVLRDDASDDVQYVSAFDGSPTKIKEGDPNYSRIKTGSDAAGYQLEHRFDGGWTFSQKLRHARRTLDKHHILSFFDTDPNTLLRQARHDVESVRETAIDTSLQGTLRAGRVEHGLLFGLDWDRADARWQRWRDMTTSLDMSNPVYGTTIAEPATAAADTRIVSTQLGLYAQDQMSLGDHWRVTLGARRDRVKTGNEDRLASVSTPQTDSATTARVGASYVVGNGWAPYASYAESFVPNIGVDAAGAVFRPSEGRQLEIGAKYMPAGSPFAFTAAVFELRKTDVVSYDPATFEPRQIGKVRSRGLELEAKADLTRQLRATASFTALDMKVLASANPDEIGRTPILTPERLASLWLDYAVAGQGLQGFGVAAGLRHVGKRWNDEANHSAEPAYALVDAAVRYDAGPWRFALNVSNLFDKRYFSGRSYGSHFRGAERDVVATVKYRF